MHCFQYGNPSANVYSLQRSNSTQSSPLGSILPRYSAANVTREYLSAKNSDLILSLQWLFWKCLLAKIGGFLSGTLSWIEQGWTEHLKGEFSTGEIWVYIFHSWGVCYGRVEAIVCSVIWLDAYGLDWVMVQSLHKNKIISHKVFYDFSYELKKLQYRLLIKCWLMHSCMNRWVH